MSVKDQDGNVVFSRTIDYEIFDLYVKEADPVKDPNQPIMIANWWFDRQVHVDKIIEPLATDSHTFVAPLKEGTKSVVVEATFRFIHEPGKEDVWQKVTKKVEF